MLKITIKSIVALDLPYLQSHKILTELNERIHKEAKENPAAILTAILTPAATRVCSAETRNMTLFNAVSAAKNETERAGFKPAPPIFFKKTRILTASLTSKRICVIRFVTIPTRFVTIRAFKNRTVCRTVAVVTSGKSGGYAASNC